MASARLRLSFRKYMLPSAPWTEDIRTFLPFYLLCAGFNRLPRTIERAASSGPDTGTLERPSENCSCRMTCGHKRWIGARVWPLDSDGSTLKVGISVGEALLDRDRPRPISAKSIDFRGALDPNSDRPSPITRTTTQLTRRPLMYRT